MLSCSQLLAFGHQFLLSGKCELDILGFIAVEVLFIKGTYYLTMKEAKMDLEPKGKEWHLLQCIKPVSVGNLPH